MKTNETIIARAEDDVEAIEADIETTRNRMDQTWERLSAKAEPSELLGGLYDWMKDKLDGLESSSTTDSLKEAGAKAGQMVKENPVPVALGVAAIGSALLPSYGERNSHDETSEFEGRLANLKQNTMDRVSRGRDTLVDKTSGARSAVADKTEGVRGATTKVTSHVSDAAQQTSEKVSELAEAANSKVQEVKEESPMALLAGAAVSGLVLGLLLPKSQREEKLYGETAHKMKAHTLAAGQTAVEKAKEKLREKRLDSTGLESRAEEAVNQGADGAAEALDEVSVA